MLKLNKKLLGLIMIGVLSLGFVGCSNTDYKQKEEMEQLMSEADKQVGMPNVQTYYERKLMKEIFELRDNSKLICYAYTKNEYSGKYVFEGKCMGYGIPYSTQFTNPERSIGNGATLPQADPNGLFGATGLSATWLIMINPETGKREVMYCEPNIVVRQSKIPRRMCEEWSLPENY